jgi:ABC transporter substrate binding protein
VLMSNAETDPEALARVGALEQGLRKLGWSQGRNISLSYRWNVADAESVRTSVRDLMDSNPDVVLAHTPATVAALKQATRTTPIVFVQASDPVTLGLVTNLASSRSNVTGFVLFEPSLGVNGCSYFETWHLGSSKFLLFRARIIPQQQVSYIRSSGWHLLLM